MKRRAALAVSLPEFDPHAMALDAAGFGKPAPEAGDEVGIFGRTALEEPDHRHRAPLRVRGERPRRNRGLPAVRIQRRKLAPA
jgi:hypothetical protein